MLAYYGDLIIVIGICVVCLLGLIALGNSAMKDDEDDDDKKK